MCRTPESEERNAGSHEDAHERPRRFASCADVGGHDGARESGGVTGSRPRDAPRDSRILQAQRVVIDGQAVV